MPLYEDQCCKCGYVKEYYSPQITEQTVTCPQCGGETDRLISVYKPKIFAAFDTRNLSPDGRAIHVGRQKDLSRYCHEYGVVPATEVQGEPPKTKFPEVSRETPKW